MLNMAATDDPHAAGSPDNMALTSIAALLAHRPDEANGLIDPRLPAADDIALWRAVRLAQLDPGSAPAAAMFAATLPLLLTYPPEIRDRLLPLVAETLVAGGEIAPAAALLDARKDDPALDLARAMLQEAKGDSAGALASYDRLGNVARPVVARARRRPRGGTAACHGAIDAKQAAERLEGLLYSWRGDRPRARAARTSGRAARHAPVHGVPRLALLRDSETLFPDDKAAIRAELTDMFAALLRGDTADSLAPLELVVGGGGERRPAAWRPRRRRLAGETRRSAGGARSAEARRAGAREADAGSDRLASSAPALVRGWRHCGCARAMRPAHWQRWMHPLRRIFRRSWRSAAPCWLPPPTHGVAIAPARWPRSARWTAPPPMRRGRRSWSAPMTGRRRSGHLPTMPPRRCRPKASWTMRSGAPCCDWRPPRRAPATLRH